MALSKETVIDQIEVTEQQTIQIRRATYIVEDGKRIAGPTYHRVAYSKGQDISQEDPKVQVIAEAVWG